MARHDAREADVNEESPPRESIGEERLSFLHLGRVLHEVDILDSHYLHEIGCT